MAKFSIIDATTGAVKYSGTPKYTGSYCKVSVLEFTEISSPTPINWKVGDYVVYSGTGRTGLTYRLYDIPQPKKQAKNALYGGGFVYSNVQFFADTKWLDIEPFRDLVPEDNNIHFTTQASWSVWTNAANLIDRFNAVMQTAHPGEWEFRLVSATSGSDLYKLLHDTWFDFTISGESVLQGLTKLYDLCGNIGWVHSVELDDDDNPVNIITVGIPPTYTTGIGTVTELYKYGIGNGLKEIRKSTTNRNELKTRLFAYGSTRNMISRYYNGLDIKDAESVYIPNLMLPLSEWKTTEVDGVEKKDASKAYIDNNVALYGLRPDTVYFDGSNGNREIYPSLEETTIGELKLAMQSTDPYYPVTGKHADSVRLDEIEAVSGITDDGQKSTGGEKYQYSETKNTQAFSEQRLSGGLQYFDETLVSFSATHGGNLSLDLSKVSPTITDTGATIKSISLFLRVVCGTKISDYAATWVKSGSAYTLSLPNVSVSCANGDTVVLRVVGTIDSNATQGANIAIAASASTILAEYATQSANTKDTFIITIPQIGFDISKRAALGSQGIATISMKDGKCGGRSFVVKSCRYNSTLDSWELTLYRGIDESLDTLFPNTTYPIAVGDHYVLLDIAMPETYIGMAEQKLLAEATALLADISVPKPFYEPSIDAKYMVDNNRMLMEGRYMQLQDTDIIDGTEYVLIDTLVINEGESNIPTYKVTLREKKRVEYSTSQSVSSGSLTSLASNNEVRTTVAPAAPVNDYFEYDPDTHTLIVKKDGNYDVNFAAYGEVTAGGVGSGGSGGVNYLYQLEDVPDYRNLRNKVMKVNASGQIVWENETAGTITGATMNGSAVQVTDGVLQLGTVITAHQSIKTINSVSLIGSGNITLATLGVQPTIDASHKLAYSLISGTPDLSDMATKTWVSGNYLAATLKGAANGLAELGSDGKVPSSQLPSYVDDVLEFSSKSAFPATGESGKIYVALDTNLTYRWSGTAYVEISPSLALGETSSTAYRGDRGKIAYDHSQESGNPHNTTWAQINTASGSAKILTDYIADSAITTGKIADLAVTTGKIADLAITTGKIAANAVTVAKLESALSWLSHCHYSNGTLVLGDENNAINFAAYGEVTAGGVGSGGGGGSGALYTCADVTAYNNSKVGRSTTEGAQVGDLLAYDGTHWHAVVAPATGVTSLGGVTGAITVRGGLTAKGSVNLAMSGTQLQASIVGLGSLAYLNGLSASDIPSLDASKITSGVINNANLPNRLREYHCSADTLDTTICGFYYMESGGPFEGYHSSNRDYMVLAQGYSSFWGSQIATDFRTNRLAVRNKNNGTWNSWGMVALTSDIPTDNNQLTNGAGYITSSGSCAYATSANNANTLESHSASYFQPASTAINTGNIGSQSVNYASSAGSVARATFGDNSNGEHDCNNINSNGLWYYTSNGPSTSIGASTNDGALYSQAHNTAWVGQIAQDYRNGSLFIRGRNSGTWTAWQTIYHSGNCNNTSTPWSCSNLTASGNVFANTGYIGKIQIRRSSRAASGISFYDSSYNSWQILMSNPTSGCGVNGNITTSAGAYVTSWALRQIIEQGTNYGWTWEGMSATGTTSSVVAELRSTDGLFHTIGSIVANGEITAGSDARWKQNIRPVLNGIDAIMKLHPSEWEWNSDNHKGSGLIAQDVQKVLPHLVKTDSEGYLHLTYDGLHAYEISAIQSHETRIERLERENRELRQQIQRLQINS